MRSDCEGSLQRSPESRSQDLRVEIRQRTKRKEKFKMTDFPCAPFQRGKKQDSMWILLFELSYLKVYQPDSTKTGK